MARCETLGVLEAISWLDGQALIVPSDFSTNGMNGWRIVSRKGQELGTPENWDAYRKAVEAHHLLHTDTGRAGTRRPGIGLHF